MKLRAILPWAAACLVLAACSGGGTTGPEALPLPASIYACEFSTGGGQFCTYWTLADSVYNAEWSGGQKAVIRVRRFDTERAMFRREDTPESTSPGQTAEYNGRIDGSEVKGTVWWTTRGSATSGTWSARW